MANWLIFGIDSDLIVIWAQIGVAIGTGALAVVTYLTVKTSKETLDSLKIQIDIAKQDFENKQAELEKPRIIDQLQEVINSLSLKVDGEITQLNEKLLLWKSQTPRNSGQFFPLKPSADFYFEADVTSRIGLIIHEISICYPVMQELSQKRYNLHISISDLFKKIYQEIKTPDFENKIGELIFKKNQSHEVYSDRGAPFNDYVVSLYEFDEDIISRPMDIPVNVFESTIINMRIAELLGQWVLSRNDPERMIISEYPSYEKDMEVLLKNDSFENYSNIFHALIEDLKTTDIQLKIEITKIRMEYREKYHLSEKECWQILQKTS